MYTSDNHTDRLTKDLDNTQRPGGAITDCSSLTLCQPTLKRICLMIHIGSAQGSAASWVTQIADHRAPILALISSCIRLVTHLDVSVIKETVEVSQQET